MQVEIDAVGADFVEERNEILKRAAQSTSRGDGHADILVTEGEQLTWYPSLGAGGFGPAIHDLGPSD